jgi:nucleotide-binding universal stress UspA family protein
MPIQDLETTLDIIHLARRLAQATQSGIELLHLVSVPDQLPLSDATKLSLPGQEVMAEAMLYLYSQPALGTSIMYCRNPSRGILWSGRQQRAGAILLGRRSREGMVRALHVHHPGSRAMDADALVAGVTLKAGLPLERYRTSIQGSTHPKKVILEKAQSADLLIIGASLSGWGRRMLRISLPEEIARESDKPMIIVRAGRNRHLF